MLFLATFLLGYLFSSTTTSISPSFYDRYNIPHNAKSSLSSDSAANYEETKEYMTLRSLDEILCWCTRFMSLK